MELGTRIVVFGYSGAGKTTFARRLADSLGVPVVELSGLYWQPGWRRTPPDELWAKLPALLDAHPAGWVCEGGYSVIPEELLRLADSAVWLRIPWRVAFWRLLRRTLRRIRTGELLWGTNRETWRRAFLSRDGILVYAPLQGLRDPGRRFGRLVDESSHTQLFELRSEAEVEAFLAAARHRSAVLPRGVDIASPSS